MMHDDGELGRLRAELETLRAKLRSVREQAEQGDAQRQRLAAIVEGSRDAIWSWTVDAVIVSWNPEASRMFQYSADEIIGQSLMTLVPAEKRQDARTVVATLLQGSWLDQHETVRMRKDGTPIPVELTVFPLLGDDGRPVGAATICRDVSVRKKFEQALRESEERFATVFKVAPVPMSISTVAEGRYLDVNDALLDSTGFSRAEIVGRTAAELGVFHDPTEPGRLRSLLRGAQPLRGHEVDLCGKSRQPRTNLLAADIIELNDVPCILTACLDIDDRKKREARLQFLDALSRATESVADADQILAITTRMLAAHLQVAVCAYADMDRDEDGFTIRGNWNAPHTASIVGRYALSAFGQRAVRTLKAGEPLVLNDNRAELPPEEAQTFLDIGLAATICIPLVKDGQLTALMAVHDTQPRVWKPDELALVKDVTDRSWVHIERVRLVDELRESENRYRGAIITGRIASWETDMVTRTRTWTREGMQLFGLDLPDGIGKVGGPDDEFWRALHPDDKHLMAQFHETANRVDTYPAEYRIVRPDGSVLWVAGRGRVVVRGPDGCAQRVANMVMDITDRKKAEENIVLLMREISHRSKNLLAVVQAIAGQTVSASRDLSEFEGKFASRLQSLASSQDLLVKENWHGVRLSDLIAQQLVMFIALEEPGLTVQGPTVVLSHQATQALGLAFHELATNALKYGAWANRAGTVAITWTVCGGALDIHWQELGGPAIQPPQRKGFGRTVTESMVSQGVDGEVWVSFAPPGFQWRLRMPQTHFTMPPHSAVPDTFGLEDAAGI